MTRCEFHGTLCGYPEPSDARCSFCHADWAKITAPAQSPDGRWLSGYGETPLDHWWRHALTLKRAETKADARKAVA